MQKGLVMLFCSSLSSVSNTQEEAGSRMLKSREDYETPCPHTTIHFKYSLLYKVNFAKQKSHWYNEGRKGPVALPFCLYCSRIMR